jgi:hypothetical protein
MGVGADWNPEFSADDGVVYLTGPDGSPAFVPIANVLVAHVLKVDNARKAAK